jgi:hypothetical protein
MKQPATMSNPSWRILRLYLNFEAAMTAESLIAQLWLP